MRRSLFTALIITLVAGCSDAGSIEQGSIEPTSVAAKTEKVEQQKKPNTSSRSLERRFIASMEKSLETQVLLIARMSPEAKAMIKEVSLTKDEKDKLRCIVDEAKARRATHLLEKGLDVGENFNAIVRADKTLSMETMENDPEIKAMMNGEALAMSEEDTEMMLEINTDCGMMSIMSDIMNRSGAMAAMMSTAAD